MKAATFEGRDSADPRIGFNVPFSEAIEWAGQRGAVLPDEFYGARLQAFRARSFAVTGLAAIDQVQAVADSLTRALAEGKPMRAWQKEIGEAEPAVLGLPNGRLELIYRNAAQTAYGIGRTIQQRENKARRPYLMWDAINDDRTRPSHAAMDGHIAPIDDGVWRVWHPPAGHNCRCARIALTEAQARARGYPKPAPGVEPDKGWGGDPTAGNDDLLAIVRQRLEQPDAPREGRARPMWLDPGEPRDLLVQAGAAISPRQPRWDFTPYDAPGPRGDPDVSTAARAAAVAFENAIRMLPEERAAVFGPDGALILEAFGDTDSVRIDGAEQAAVIGATFTHNHPNGAPFSVSDLMTGTRNRFGELRAVGPQMRYILTPGSRGWPTEQQVLDAIAQADTESAHMTWVAITRDGLHPRYAALEKTHFVWTLVAKLFGMVYRREHT